MGQTQEWIKKRRQYVKKKGRAYTKAGIYSFLAVLCVVLTGCLSIAAPICVLLFIQYFFSHSLPIPVIGFLALASAILSAILFGRLFWLFANLAHKAQQNAIQLPYVAPVTAKMLPVEEVLLRGSGEPVQEHSKLLLRGTDGSAGTGKQELLRSSQSEEHRS